MSVEWDQVVDGEGQWVEPAGLVVDGLAADVAVGFGAGDDVAVPVSGGGVAVHDGGITYLTQPHAALVDCLMTVHWPLMPLCDGLPCRHRGQSSM